jgi:hypothetical protein
VWVSRFRRLSGSDNGEAGAGGQLQLPAFPKGFVAGFVEVFEEVPAADFVEAFCGLRRPYSFLARSRNQSAFEQ